MGKLAPQVLPPLLLLGLLAVQFDPFVFALWIAGFACAVVSLARLGRMGLARRRGQPVSGAQAIRPALTPAIFIPVAAYSYHAAGIASGEANEFARAIARQAQAACERDRKCAAPPADWRAVGGDRSVTQHAGRRVDYRVPPDRCRFRISVHHPLDRIHDFEGGVGSALTEREAIR